jgi:quinol monooxygenase YgiN
MDLFIFARFHARSGKEVEVAKALHAALEPSRQEPGCRNIHAFRCTRDPRLFYIQSRWQDEAAFETHAKLAHTVRFQERMEPLIDHAFDVARTEQIG